MEFLGTVNEFSDISTIYLGLEDSNEDLTEIRFPETTPLNQVQRHLNFLLDQITQWDRMFRKVCEECQLPKDIIALIEEYTAPTHTILRRELD